MNHNVRIKWLGCAGYEMHFGDFSVVSDPFITEHKKTPLTAEDVEKCDVMILTHGHYDHLTDIPALYKKFKAPVICGELTAEPLMRWANLSPMDVYPAYPGQELDFDAVKITPLQGQHTRLGNSYEEVIKKAENSVYLPKHPELMELHLIGAREYRNYLLTAPDGFKVLHWGNPVRRPVLYNIAKSVLPDVLILQCTGTMPDADAAVELVKEAGVSAVIANHFDFPGDYREAVATLREKLRKAVPDCRFIVPAYGQWIDFTETPANS